MVPKLTAAGRNLLLRALAGETINFTKLQIGNGAAQEPEKATALENPIMTVSFSKIEVGTEYVTLAATFSNSEIESGFHITEAGYFATDPDDSTKEILYALGNEDESTGDYVPDKTSRILEMQLSSMIFIGDVENVTAAISSSLTYATKDDFDKHVADAANPHKVTAAQVGLDKVPNLAPEEQVPSFTEASSLVTINSGETVATMLGKIRLAISNLIAHITNKANPHGVSASQIGAAAKSHTHSTQDINSGTLPIVRGGTGATTADTARESLGAVTTRALSGYVLRKENWVTANLNGYECYAYDLRVYGFSGKEKNVTVRLSESDFGERAAWSKIVQIDYDSNWLHIYSDAAPKVDIAIDIRTVE